MESVRHKIYRSREHYVELRDRLVEYYTRPPGSFLISAGSTIHSPIITFQEAKPIPQRFGLILGDALGCLRSSLDYLIYELVLIRGKEHHRNNQFPITSRAEDYRKCVRNHFLDGVGSEARAVIEMLQPYASPEHGKHPLTILNALANINKHRRVILANFVTRAHDPAVN